MQTEVDVIRLLIYRCAAALDDNEGSRRLAAQAKLKAAEVLQFVTQEGMQVLGVQASTKTATSSDRLSAETHAMAGRNEGWPPHIITLRNPPNPAVLRYSVNQPSVDVRH